MNWKKASSFLSLFFITVTIFAQSDAFPGSWKVDYLPVGGNTPIYIDLQIAAAENNVLYPAQFSLKYGDFKAVYQLLLVRKSSRELAISKNKYPVSESPFNLGNAPLFINGIFDLSRDLRGLPLLTLNRLVSKQNNLQLPDSPKLDKTNQLTAAYLLGFLKESELALSKSSSIPWKDKSSELLVSPSVAPVYFGLLDTIYLPVRDGIAQLAGSGGKKNDIVTVALNGRTILDKVYLEKKNYSEELVLDTGLNMLVLFADNFGNELPNKGKLSLGFADKKIHLDFTNRGDSAASFIVVPLYCSHDKNKDVWFSEFIPSGIASQPLQTNEKMVGSLLATSKQLTLAIWDDAVEDGDSISIKINGDFITRGFPVLKHPQFITVTLKPGPNSISFIADNIGSIPPNTSVLEIIDGKKRKSFMLESIPGENKILNIFYEIKVD
jgi:hypothetical protein